MVSPTPETATPFVGLPVPASAQAADTKDEARNTLPPIYRRQATIVQLCKFGLDELPDLMRRHEERPEGG